MGLAAGTFTLISAHFTCYQHCGKDELIGVDGSRIIASVVSEGSGIHFSTTFRPVLRPRGRSTRGEAESPDRAGDPEVAGF